MQYRDATWENTPEYTFDGMQCIVKVLRVVDGDTVDIALYHEGSRRMYRHRVRLYGIDTPEKHPSLNQPNREEEMAASKQAADALTVRFQAIDWMPMAHFHKADKYGRLLCTFYEPPTTICSGPCTTPSPTSLNDWMVQEGYAYAYFGKTKQAYCKKGSTATNDSKDKNTA